MPYQFGKVKPLDLRLRTNNFLQKSLSGIYESYKPIMQTIDPSLQGNRWKSAAL